MTTFASWRWVFAAEVVLVVVILLCVRSVSDAEPVPSGRFDFVGAGLSIVGLALTVFGVLRSGEWGWVQARAGAPTVLGTSPVVWLVIGGLLIVFAFFLYERHRADAGLEPLVDPAILRVRQLDGGLAMFFFQYLVQAGLFFTIPLFLSVVLELSALQTGVRLVPLSLALLVTAIGVPRLAPGASPRLVVRLGLLAMVAGVLVLIGGIGPTAAAGIVTIPMVLMGLGIGALASQLGAVTVSAVDDRRSAEVGGLQNTVTNLGASLGTALVGAVLVSSLTAGLVHGINTNAAIPADVRTQASTQLTSGVPFTSDSDLRVQLDRAGVPSAAADAIVTENAAARLGALRDALWVVALAGVLALFLTGLVPTVPVGRPRDGPEGGAPEDGGDDRDAVRG